MTDHTTPTLAETRAAYARQGVPLDEPPTVVVTPPPCTADLEDRCSNLLAENLRLAAELRTVQQIARSILIDAAGDGRPWISVEEIRLKCERMMGDCPGP